MKRYTPEKLVSVSRYQALFPTLSPPGAGRKTSEEITGKAKTKYREPLAPGGAYCD